MTSLHHIRKNIRVYEGEEITLISVSEQSARIRPIQELRVAKIAIRCASVSTPTHFWDSTNVKGHHFGVSSSARIFPRMNAARFCSRLLRPVAGCFRQRARRLCRACLPRRVRLGAPNLPRSSQQPGLPLASVT